MKDIVISREMAKTILHFLEDYDFSLSDYMTDGDYRKKINNMGKAIDYLSDKLKDESNGQS